MRLPSVSLSGVRPEGVITGDGVQALGRPILPDFYGSVALSRDVRFGSGLPHFTIFEEGTAEPRHLDFGMMANACGVPAERVTDPADLTGALTRATAGAGPVPAGHRRGVWPVPTHGWQRAVPAPRGAVT